MDALSTDAPRPSFTADEVEAVLDEVRPYLQRDGGNISLVAIEGQNVRVVLHGACRSCPASAVTLHHGVEKRLREELAGFGELIAEGPPKTPHWWRRLF